MAAWTIARLLAVTADYLAGKGSSSPRLDAELLLAHSLGEERISLYTQHDRPVTGEELDAYRELVARRARREPVAYILGHAAFRYLDLHVSPAVLIPRPETEELVDAILAWLRTHPLLPVASEEAGAAAPPRPAAAVSATGVAATPTPPLSIADVGTGSGAIALSLASEAGLPVLAMDRSPEALAVARANAERLGLAGRVTFQEGDLLEGLASKSLRVVVSNPPYVSEAEFGGLEPDVREYEPAEALLAGPDGLAAYRRLVPQAAAALGPGGALFLEVGAAQAEAVADLAREAGFALTDVIRDLSGKDRIVRAVRPGAAVLPLEGLGPADLERAAAALRAGGVFGLPTDTVYGLAAAWDSTAGVRALFQAKGRGSEQPVAVLFPSVEAVRAALPDLEERAGRALAALLPGPYTFVVQTAVSRVPLVGTEDSLGVRVPDQPALLRVLAGLGVPLAATSANRTGMPAAGCLAAVEPALLAHAAAAFAPAQTSGTGPPPAPASEAPAAGPAGTDASTVVDLRPLAGGRPPVVLREGAVGAAAALAAVEAALAGREGGQPGPGSARSDVLG